MRPDPRRCPARIDRCFRLDRLRRLHYGPRGRPLLGLLGAYLLEISLLSPPGLEHNLQGDCTLFSYPYSAGFRVLSITSTPLHPPLPSIRSQPGTPPRTFAAHSAGSLRHILPAGHFHGQHNCLPPPLLLFGEGGLHEITICAALHAVGIHLKRISIQEHSPFPPT